MKRRIMYILIIIVAAAILLLASCTNRKGQIMDGDGMLNSYTHISQEEAREMMKKDDGHVIVDVRTYDEYFEGHIPGAINIPNEVIEEECENELPDKDQIILVYCRSGRRSKEASQKLFDKGYTRVYEFGGIIDWEGELATGREYPERADLIFEVNGRQIQATLDDNDTARALFKKLKEEKEIEITLKDYGGFEKTGALPWSLPSEDERITAVTGDVLLYEGDKICVFYGENTYEYSRIGRFVGLIDEELEEFFGEGEVKVTLFLDYWDY